MTESPPTLYVLGSGPGIGRAVAMLFSAKRYTNVALFARSADQLKVDKEAVQSASSSSSIISGKDEKVQVRTYAVDVADSNALGKALDQADQDLGRPECVFYNAARVMPSKLLDHDVKEIEYDFKINVSALYIIAQRYIPHLIDLASKHDVTTAKKPGLIVTSSLLPVEPIPEVFALSLVKAAQRNLMQSLAMTYGGKGVHLSVVVVSGPVSEEEELRNPKNIAERTWEWLDGAAGAEDGGKGGFEVQI